MSDFKKNDKRVTGSRKKRRDDRWSSPKTHEDLKEKVVYINRCAKVVKGGRRFGFSALVLVGDQKGRIGVGCGKAKEVPEAIRKGNERARKNMLSFDFGSLTVPHLAIGVADGGRVLLRPAAPGTGIIAGGGVRAVLEVLGIKDVLTKSMGSSNQASIVRATLNALGKMRTREAVVSMRNAKSDYVMEVAK